MMGKTMYALGYDWRYVLDRCLLTLSKSPKEGLEILWSWLKHSDVERLDVAKWVNNWQKQKFPERIRQFMKRT